jgi:PAS domain S-box-containing protein
MPYKQPKTILLVEDEVVIAMDEKIALERCGYRVAIVNSGERAIAAFAEPNSIDLVLMDIDLGEGIDGTEAAKRILDEREIPIVFLSSHTEPEIVNKTATISSYGYIVKNSGITVLDASIRMAFRLFESRDREKKYRAIIDQSQDGIVIADDSGKIVTWNSSLASMTGIPEGEALGQPLWVLQWNLTPKRHRTPLLLESSKKFMLDALELKIDLAKRLEGVMESRDGTIKNIEFSDFIVETNNGRLLGAFFREITERKNSEKALAETQMLQAALVDSTDDMIWSMRVDGSAFRLLSFNRSFGDYFLGSRGIRIELGMTSEELFTDPQEISYWEEQYRKVLAEGSYSTESRIPTGSTMLQLTFNLLKRDGEIFGISVFGKDITKQTLANEKMRENEKRLNDIILSGSDWIWESDENWTYTYCSKKGEIGRAHV